jgi:hypothetical protein
MSDGLTENVEHEESPDPLLRAWQLTLKFFAQSPEMHSRLTAFSPAELKRRSDQFPLQDYIKDPLDALRRLHLQQARPDPGRVHKSWYKPLEAKQISPVRRVLRAESEAVPGSLNEIILESAKTLSAERLVGDAEAWIGDPEIVLFFEHESPIGWLRMLAWSGRLRRWVAGEKDSFCGLPAFAKCSRGEDWPEIARKSLAQLRTAAKGKPVRASRYGLISLAMLASQVDSRRRQWIFQHLPMSAGALIAPVMRTEKKPLDENEMQFETWLASWAIGFEDDCLKLFLAEFQGKAADLSGAGKLEDAGSHQPLNYETTDMPGMLEVDQDYDLLSDSSEERISMPADLFEPDDHFELDESIEIVNVKAENSGIFDQDIDQLVIEDSSEIEIEINDGHDDIALNDDDDEKADDDDSSFHIGDLEL